MCMVFLLTWMKHIGQDDRRVQIESFLGNRLRITWRLLFTNLTKCEMRATLFSNHTHSGCISYCRLLWLKIIWFGKSTTVRDSDKVDLSAFVDFFFHVLFFFFFLILRCRALWMIRPLMSTHTSLPYSIPRKQNGWSLFVWAGASTLSFGLGWGGTNEIADYSPPQPCPWDPST